MPLVEKNFVWTFKYLKVYYINYLTPLPIEQCERVNSSHPTNIIAVLIVKFNSLSMLNSQGCHANSGQFV